MEDFHRSTAAPDNPSEKYRLVAEFGGMAWGVYPADCDTTDPEARHGQALVYLRSAGAAQRWVAAQACPGAPSGGQEEQP